MVGPSENKVFIPANNNNIRPPPIPIPPPSSSSSGFMNFPNNNNNKISPFPYPVNNNNNQFYNPFQQQQQQMFCPNPMMMMMNPTTTLFNPNVVGNQQQVLLQNTIQNISQLLQLQNQNHMTNPGHQFGVMQPGNPFLPPPASSSSVNFQNQMIPQNQNLYMNPMFGMMANSNGPMQHVNNNHGQPTFVSPPSTQTQNPAPNNITQDNNGTNVNSGWADSRHKNFRGHKTNDTSNKRFKSHKHGKEKFGIHNGNMSKAKANNISSVNSGPGNSTKFEMKLPSLKYTEQEIKQWREARKKHYPKSTTVEKGKKEQTLSDVTDQADTLRRQQLKEVLAKQAELGLEVADVPSSFLSSPTRALAQDKQNYREKKPERERYKKGKFQKKNRKRTRQTHEQKPNKREQSLLQKLLTRDIKRDKNHLLQVFRFMTANSFFKEEADNSLKFPSVIVRETNPQETEMETIGSVSKDNDDKAKDEEEGEITD